jgi:hypothetical protein
LIFYRYGKGISRLISRLLVYDVDRRLDFIELHKDDDFQDYVETDYLS